MNTLEQFIAVYEPEGDVSAGFRKMLEQVIQEIKRKAQPDNEIIGMRDYFAAKAMQSLILGLDNGNESQAHLIPSTAYGFADAMMEARKK